MRRGQTWLTEHFMNIVIGITCLVILVILAYNLFYSSQETKRIEQAKESFLSIKNLLNQGSGEVTILNPGTGEWGILRFSDITDAPDICNSSKWESCLCICKAKRIWETGLIGKFGSECVFNGESFCTNITKSFSLGGSYIKVEGSYIYFGDGIPFANLPLVLQLKDNKLSRK